VKRALFILVAACGEGHVSPIATAADAGARPHHQAPEVHAYPPHAIRADGVGPYRIGTLFSDVLYALPQDPRVELLQIGRLADWRVARAENGQILIGAEDDVAFVSVLAPDVARTSSGVGVGSTGAELIKALGPEAEERGAADRKIYEFPSLPNVRFVTDAPPDAPPEEARVVAAIVVRPDLAAPGEAPTSSRAAKPAPPSKRPEDPCRVLVSSAADVIEAAHPRVQAVKPLVRYGCFTGTQAEAIVYAGGELSLVGQEAGKLKKTASVSVPGGLDLLAALDADGDDRDDVVWGAHRRSDRELTVEIHVLRWEAGHFTEVASGKPFTISDDAAAGAGTTTANVDLALELRREPGALAISGLYMNRPGGTLRELAPAAPAMIRVESHRPVALPDGGMPESAPTSSKK
jgi:hypothetical protein